MSRTSRKTTKQVPQKASVRTAARNASTSSPQPSILPKPPTKTVRLIAMLQADGGANVEEISVALGWLPHSTRAALTSLRKAGHDIERIKPQDGPSRYRIATGSAGETN